jgi:prophage antirepressor-like protein
VVTILGSPWFILADVCRVLEIGNPSMAASRLDADEKGITTVDTLGGGQSLVIVSESGLYSLILTSRKPQAKAFKRWITGTVIPSIRIVDRDGAPWFVAADVCAILGLVNHSMAMRVLCFDEKGVNRIDTPGGPQSMSIISESGLYKLILRSDKPQARPFQDWVTQTVLPAIRKDGGYVMGEEKVITGELDEDGLMLLALEVLGVHYRPSLCFPCHAHQPTPWGRIADS